MKKIKLIAPIFGAAVTLGAAIPLASCQEKGTIVEVIVNPEKTGQNVVITSKSPKAIEGKELNAIISWKHYEDEEETAKEIVQTFISKVEVSAIIDGVEETIDPYHVHVRPLDYGKASLKVDAEVVKTNMKIVVTVRDPEGAKMGDINTYVESSDARPVKAYIDDVYTSVNGIVSYPDFTGLTQDDYVFEFFANLKQLNDNFTKFGETIISDAGKNKNVYVYLEESNHDRGNPYDVGGIKLWNQNSGEVKEITASYDGDVQSVKIPLLVSQSMITDGQWYLVGWFSWDIAVPWIDLNGSRFCMFHEDEINK